MLQLINYNNCQGLAVTSSATGSETHVSDHATPLFYQLLFCSVCGGRANIGHAKHRDNFMCFREKG